MFWKRSAQSYVDKVAQLLETGDIPTAMKNLEKALKIEPEHPQACYYLGCVLMEQGELKGAIESFRHSFASSPPEKALLPLYNLGLALQEDGQINEAIKTFGQVIQLDPEMADAWINRGRLLDDSGMHEKA